MSRKQSNGLRTVFDTSKTSSLSNTFNKKSTVKSQNNLRNKHTKSNNSFNSKNPIKYNSNNRIQFVGLVAAIILSLFASFVFAEEQLISLQGKITDNNGNLVDSGNVTVTIWDSATGGGLVYNSTGNFSNNISNGFFDIVLGSVENGELELNFSETYYMDLQINEEDIDWDGQERRIFQSPVGTHRGGSDNFSINTDVLFVDTENDNVGIGTAGPLAKLHVYGDGTEDFGTFAFQTPTQGARISHVHYGSNGDWYIRGADTDGNVYIQDTGGNVGIGTSSTPEKLVVIGNVNISGTLNVSGRVSFPNLANCDTIDTDANGVLTCGTDDGGAGGNNNSLWNETADQIYPSDLAKLTNVTDFAANQTLFVNGSRVGIGTDSPEYSLDINGTFRINGADADWIWDSAGGLSPGYFSSGLNVNSQTLSNSGDIQLQQNSVIQWRDTSGTIFTVFDINQRNLSIIPDGSGNVGIGQLSPNATLGVSGDANITGNIQFPGLVNCDTIDTDGAGNLVCGTDDGGAGVNNNSLWNRSSTAIFPNFQGLLVGIGNTIPNNTLDVSGNVNVSGNITAAIINVTGTIQAGSLSGDGSQLSNVDLSTTNEIQNLWETIATDSGSVAADASTDTLTITGSGGITTSQSGDTITIDGSAGGFLNNSDINVTQLVANNTLFVNGSRVGIGTSNPNSLGSLHVAGGVVVDSGNILYFGTSSTAAIGGTAGSSGNLIFYTNGAQRARFDSDGNLGIGNRNPNSTLDVTGNVNVSGNLSAGSLNITAGISVRDLTSCTAIETDSEGNFICGTDDTSGTNSITGEAAAGYIALFNDTFEINQSAIYQDSEGQIGVNTADPAEAFAVTGNLSTTESNNTLGSMNVLQFNTTCVGFRMGQTGGLILSCTD